MEGLKTENPDLAAAMFFTLGEAVPHPRALENEAYNLKNEINDREKFLLKIIELCGNAQTPKELYLVEKAYSWLGKNYYEKTIEYANQYLHTLGWDELFNRTKEEHGIVVNYAVTHRASVLIDLARAQEGLGHLDAALFNFMEAYRLQPYSAMNAIKAADVIVKMRNKEEGLLFLLQQKESAYYAPVKYTDVFGNTQHNDVFKQLLDAHILKLKENR
jgi:tetratricopeptide (TPR) repeat protein